MRKIPPPRVLYTDVNGGQILGYTEADIVDAMTGYRSTGLRLNDKEARAIFALIEHGSTKLAADALGLSLKTFETHLRRARERNNKTTTLQLVVAYVRLVYDNNT